MRRRARRSGCRRRRRTQAGVRASAGRRSQSGSWVPVPHSRRLEARPGSAVAPAFVALGVIHGSQPAEHRCAEPPIQERIHVARRLQCVGHRLVGLPSVRPRLFVLHAGCAADQHEVADRQFGVQGDVQRHPGPQGVPEEVAAVVTDLRPDGVCHKACSSREGRRAPRRRRHDRAGPAPARCATRPAGRRSVPTAAPSA